MVSTANILGDRQAASRDCQVWEGAAEEAPSPHSHAPGPSRYPGPPTVAPSAEQEARPPSVQCSGAGPQPLVPPSWPEAQGPTDSGPSSWAGPQLLFSPIHGPRGERWQDDEEAWPRQAVQGLEGCSGVSRFGGRVLD